MPNLKLGPNNAVQQGPYDDVIQLLENQNDTLNCDPAASPQHTEFAASVEPPDASEVGTERLRPDTRQQLDRDIRALPLDHDGHAQAVALMHKGKLLYCSAYSLMYYTGSYWKREDAHLVVRRCVRETLRYRQNLLLKRDTDNDPVMDTNKIARQKVQLACNRGPIHGTLSPLEERLAVSAESFDDFPHHLNVQNGVVDLRTGALEPHAPSQRFTFCLSTPYLVDADRTLWMQFLHEVLADQEIIECLQTYIGYALTGLTTLEKFLYLTGTQGRNGKGTFTQTLTKLLGEPLAKEVEFGTFTRNRSRDANNYDLAPLKPCRLIVANEGDRHETLNQARLKMVTGGDAIYCAFKGRSHFQYRPKFKLILVSNHDVQATFDDSAFWQRIIRIEFPKSFAGREDTTLKGHLQSPEALCGVLAWCIEGAKRFYTDGLTIPAQLVLALEQVRAERDIIQPGLVDCAQSTNPDAWTSRADLRASYVKWCHANSVSAVANKDLWNILRAKGHKEKKNNERGFSGLTIIPPPTDEQPR